MTEIQEVTAQVVVDMLTGEMAHTHQRGTFNFDKARKMRRDSVVSLARRVAIAAIELANWTIEADDEWEWLRQFIEDEVMPIRSHLLRTAVGGLIDFGWRAYEKVFEYRDSYEYSTLNDFGDQVPATLLCIDRVRPLKNDFTWVRYDKWTGRFTGLAHLDQYTGQKLFIDAPHSLFINFDEEGLGEYGEADMVMVEPHYDSWEDCNNANKRYDRKMSGSFLTVKYKVGKTMYNGKMTDNSIIAKDVITAMQSTGAIAIPMEQDRMTAAGGADAWSELWKVEFLNAANQEADFVTRLMYLDKMKARSLKVTERSVFEGEFGTKADAQSHADSMLMIHHLRHCGIVNLFNWHLVNQLCVANAGPEAEGAVRIVPHELSDKNRQLFMSIFEALLNDPGKGVEMLDKIDGDEVMKTLEIPLSENNELNMMPEPNATGADWRDDIFVGTGVTDVQPVQSDTPPWWAADVKFSQASGEYALFEALTSGYNELEAGFCPGSGPGDNSCNPYSGMGGGVHNEKAADTGGGVGGGRSTPPLTGKAARLQEKMDESPTKVGRWNGYFDYESVPVTLPSGKQYEATVEYVDNPYSTTSLNGYHEFQFVDDQGNMGVNDRTGGEAFHAFTGMSKALVKYVDSRKPEDLLFSAEGGSRYKLYDRFAKALKQLLPNYTVYRHPANNPEYGGTWRLKRRYK